MPITVPNPVTVPTIPAATYDTIVVLSTQSMTNPATCAVRYTARVGLGKFNGAGGYDVLPSSIKTIVIPNMWVDGAATEQSLAMQVAETLALRYNVLAAPRQPTPTPSGSGQ